MLGGKVVLRRTVEAFLVHANVDGVLCVIHPDDRALYDQAVAGLDLPDPVHGGETRQDSVRNGLDALKAANPDRVLIGSMGTPTGNAARDELIQIYERWVPREQRPADE